MSLSEWKEYRFKDVTINYDSKRKPLSSKQREKMRGKYPYYGAQGIIDHLNDFIFDGTYLLIAEDGENLKSKKQDIAQLARGQFWVNNHAHIVTNNHLSDIRYLCYVLNSTDISGYVTGSAQPKLSQANLNLIKVKLPSITEQKVIADTLSCLDDKIELNNRINKTLEEMAQAIFKQWFVDFDFPDENGQPYKSSGGEMEESELGLIPKGWKVKQLGENVMLLNKTVNPQKNLDTLFEHFSIPAYDSGRVPVFELGKQIKSNKFLIDNKSILVSKLNPSTKRIWKPLCLTKHSVCSTEFMVYQSSCPDHTDFFYALLDSSEFHNYLLAHVTGSTNSRQRANPGATLYFKFAYPGKAVLEKFIGIAKPIYKKIQYNTLQSHKLANIRDSLLPKLMSGEIRVPVEEVPSVV